MRPSPVNRPPDLVIGEGDHAIHAWHGGGAYGWRTRVPFIDGTIRGTGRLEGVLLDRILELSCSAKHRTEMRPPCQLPTGHNGPHATPRTTP